MKKLRFAALKFLAVAFVILTPTALAAAPANPRPIQEQQADGTPITLHLRGTSSFSWWEDVEGNVVVFDEDSGNWYYARATHNALLPTPHLAGVPFDGDAHVRIQRGDIRHLITGAWQVDVNDPTLQGPAGVNGPLLPNGGRTLQPGDMLPTPNNPIQQPQAPQRPIMPPGQGQSPDTERPPILPPTISNVGMIRDLQAAPPSTQSIVPLGATSSTTGGVSWAFAPGVPGFPGQPEAPRDGIMPGQPRQTITPAIPGAPRQSAPNLRAPAVTADNQRLLVVMIDFDNVSMAESQAFYHNKYFGRVAGAATVANFFNDMSGGRDIFVPAGSVTGGGRVASHGRDVTVRPSEHPGVVHATVHTPHHMPNWARYSGNAHVSTRYIINSVVAAVHGTGFDFAGVTVAAIFAGGEAADNYNAGGRGQVWAHAWSYAGSYVGQNGWMRFMAYGETQARSITMGIGTVVHELGHILGLPDLYCLFGDSMGLGPYSIMAHGNWSMSPGDPAPGHTPAPFDAWSLMQLGFVNPIVIEATDWQGQVRSATLNGSTANQDIILVASRTCNYQFFIIENRQMSTRWDMGLYGWFGFPANAPLATVAAPGVPAGATRGTGGLLIYHVDIRGSEHTVTLREADQSQFLASVNSNWNNFGDHFHSAPNFPTLLSNHFYNVQGVAQHTNVGISTSCARDFTMQVNINMAPVVPNGDRGQVQLAL
ncbi:MAG: immune inhibitor A [Defluviitaleaceae bacterium]|nr:immune inhibitor A [Defluviitaleaceae bacterium]